MYYYRLQVNWVSLTKKKKLKLQIPHETILRFKRKISRYSEKNGATFSRQHERERDNSDSILQKTVSVKLAFSVTLVD
jgi:hypothetical protein